VKYAEAQIILTQARILKAHAEIVSGAYKQRPIERGMESYPELYGDDCLHFRPLADEEKLVVAMQTLRAHVDFLFDLTEVIGRRAEKGV
jgi:hypothetical protein